MRTKISVLLLIAFFSCSDDMSSADQMGTGQGGSMTRFAIQGNMMYLMEETTLRVFDIENHEFSEVNSVAIGVGMETIFAKGDYLYMGARDAMYIYGIADRKNPAFIFRYEHLVSCDPVVVQGNRAFVTLRSGSACNLGVNALEILDISNPNDPKLVKNYPMTKPHGLAVDGNRLFICDGAEGLKYYDITDELDIRLVASRDDFFAYDVIARNGLATITGEDGIFQFTYDVDHIKLISKIPVAREQL